MPATTGVNFLLRIENPASPGTYRVLGGQRGATLRRSTDAADSTNKDSAGWHEELPTIRHWGIDADAVLLETDVAYADLETAFNNNTRLNVRVSMPNGNTYTGLAVLADMPIEGPHDDVATIALTLNGSGVLTKA